MTTLLGAGIRIVSIEDFREVKVRLKLHWWNKNANRTQYGGSIFSLTDPIYCLMLMGILGDGYFVWDKQASINFIKPDQAIFVLSLWLKCWMVYCNKLSMEISHFRVCDFVKDNDGNVVSEVKRQLYVRKKPDYRNQTAEEKQAA